MILSASRGGVSVSSKKNGRGHSSAAGSPVDAEPSLRVATIDLLGYVIEPAVIALVSKLLCDRHTSIPVSRTDNILIVAMADPGNPTTFDELHAHTGLRIEAVTAPEAAILEAITKYYGA
jgi:type IV pilus assembly protein PilB